MATPTTPHPVLTRYYRRHDEREPFVTALFDGAARSYDRVCAVMSLGSGRWYRRFALRRAGLRPGMRVLDVATGTGLVARAAAGILGDGRAVVGVDPSAGMLLEARRALPGPLVRGRAEGLPFRDGAFDMVTMGYAVRHVAGLEPAFAEFRRVLRPGGRLLILEISRAPSAARRWAVRVYFTRILPVLVSATTRNAHARVLTRYYWDTIASCVAPEVILAALSHSGFTGVERRVFGGMVSEYLAVKPGA